MITEAMRKNVEIARLLGWRLIRNASASKYLKRLFLAEPQLKLLNDASLQDVSSDDALWYAPEFYRALPNCYTSVDAALEHLIEPLLPNVVFGLVPLNAQEWQAVINVQSAGLAFSAVRLSPAAAICEAWLAYKREAGQSP